MNVWESLLLAAPSIIIALCGIAYQIYLNRNKPAIDQEEVLHTRVETDSLKAQITEKVMALANAQLKILSDRVAEIELELAEEKQAREAAEERAHQAEERAAAAEKKNTIYLNGIYILTNQLLRLDKKPEWTPTPTGPLSKPSDPPT
jgi:hypothetical protein